MDLDSAGTITITGGGELGEDVTVTGTIDDDATDASDLVIVAALGAVGLQGNVGGTMLLRQA